MHKCLHSGPASRWGVRHFVGATASLGLLLGAAGARAQTLYGLGTVTSNVAPYTIGQQALIPIDPGTGTGMASLMGKTITGVATGQTLVGIDYRPATGVLYGLGYDAATTTVQLYTLDPATSVATPVPGAGAYVLNLGTATDRIGFDFNPTVDRIRVVSTNDVNVRLNPTNGAVAATDLSLNYAGGIIANPGVGAVAYTNSFAGSTATTLYDYDELNQITNPGPSGGTTTGLSIQSPPNDGVLSAPVAVNFNGLSTGVPRAIDIDIYYNPDTRLNQAFLTEVSATGSSNFYVLDLATGLATRRGNTVPASTPFEIRDIAAAPAVALVGQLAYGVTSLNTFISFDTGNPSVIRSATPITGIATGQTLVGTDFRPNTGQLFGLGYDFTVAAGSPSANLYTIDLATGVATLVPGSSAIALDLGDATNTIGFDFNPTVDRIRVVSTNDRNYRLNPNDGAIAAPDGNLAYAAGTPNAGTSPTVGTAAYVNSFVGSTTTFLYTLDHALGLINFQNPPNDGTQAVSRPLTGVNGVGVGGALDAQNDFDVYFDGTANIPYLAAVPTNQTASRLYRLAGFSTTATTEQAATDLGSIGSGLVVRDISVALASASTVAANPAAVTGQLLYAVAGGNLISFDSNAPSVIRSAVNIGAPAAGQTLAGVDFRPATGQLFALGYNPATGESRLYTVNLTTGALTAVGTAPITLMLGTATDRIGFDFNPTVDRIRVVSTNRANYRLNPNDGSITLRDGDLGLADVSGAAYTNNQSTANTTQLFDYNAVTGTLYLQNPPNNGTLVSVGGSGLTAAAADGSDFDIFNTPGTSTNLALLALNTNATAGRTTFDNLYTIDLGTAATTNLGTIGQGTNVTGLAAFIMAGTGLTWNGSVSTAWATAANWTPNQVPTANNDVTIPGGTPNQPTVSSAQQARLVTLTTGAVLTLADGGTLTTGGNFTNNGGSVAGTGTGTLVLGGTASVLGGTSLSAFPNLTTTNAATTGGPVAVQRALTLSNNLTLGAGQPFTLLSSAIGTAYVVNVGSAALVGSATVQRAIDGSLNSGLGYRHYSSPVANSTVGDLTTAGFTPVVNPAYNTSATPGAVTPFPTVYGYDQSRLATTTNNSPVFDKGFVSPAALSDALVPGQGYAVNIGASQVVDFVGTLNNSDLAVNLARNTGPTAADAGWALLGNPYPAPLDYSLVAPADRTNLDAAIYVYQSTGQYVGQYRAYTNGIGGNPVLPVAQGFFARVSAGQTSGTLTFRNSQRLTTANATTFQRTTADIRPQVQLELRGSTGPADAFYAYAEADATPAFDTQFDAAKLPNPNGLNLAGAATSGEAVAIDGRAAFTAATALPLTVGVPAAGTYSLSAAALSNLPTGLDAYLADAQTGQTLKLTAGASYAFSVTAAQATTSLSGRFQLLFRPATALATVASLTPEAVGVYPNPAHERFTVTVPGLAQATTVRAELLNTLGQVVRRQSAALPSAGTQFTLEAGDLATGVYTLRLQAGATTLAKRVVIQ